MPETDLTILCDHTLLENCDRVDPLQQARQLHQQQIAGHDRAARRQRGLGPLEVGMNPLAIAAERHEAINVGLRQRECFARRQFPSGRMPRDFPASI